MKIGIEIQRLFRKDRFGIETAAYELIAQLSKINSKHEIIIFTKANTLSPKTIHDLKIIPVRGKLFIDFEQFFLPLKAKNEQVDILHCTGNTTPLFYQKKIIQTLHDIIFMDPIPTSDTLYQRFGNYYRRFIVPHSVKKSKGIITVSEFEKTRILNRLKIEDDKIHVIYNGVSPIFNAARNVSKEEYIVTKYQLPKEYILFLGNTSFRKNPVRVIEAYLLYLAQDKNPHPIVTPGLDRKFITDVLKKNNQLKYEKLFITPGYIDRVDLPALYSLSKLFLFPSLAEGFGMPVIEAMASGTPVITSNTSSLPEISGGAAHLVNPLSVQDIANSINHILSNSEVQMNLIKLGKIQASKFDWKITAEKTLELYEKIHANKN